MSVEGLDKIKKMDENKKVEIGGLDMCRPVDNSFDENSASGENEQPFEPRKISADGSGSGMTQEITGLNMCRPVTADINADNAADFSEDVLYGDVLSGGGAVNITGLDSIKHISQPNLPRISGFATSLIKLADRARELDTEFKVFGSDKHQYKFNPVTALSIVRDFEKRHCITFPQAYVDFLTQVGDGGAGPDLGLYSLDEVEYNNYTDHSETSCALEHVRARSDFHTVPYTIEGMDPLVTSQLDEEKWFSWYDELGRACTNGMNFRKKATELYNGIVEISAMGGTNAMFLICEGDLKGKLCAFTLDIDDRVHIFDMTFEDWMLGHFKRIIEKFEKKNAEG